jgi:hypothetical protein
VNELGDCLILWEPSLGWDLGCHNGMIKEWEDHVVKAKKPSGGNNNWTWAGWKKLEWSLFSALDSTMRRGGKNRWGSSLSFSPHIVCCLQSLAQRNVIKVLEEGGSIAFSLNFPFPLEEIFLPPTLNLCSC